MANSLLSHIHHHHVSAALLSSPQRSFYPRHLAAAPLVPAKASVGQELISSRRRSFDVVRAMPPAGGENAGKPHGAGGSTPTGTNLSVPPQPGRSPGGLPLPSIPIWARWVLGSIFCLAIPLYRRFRSIQGVVEKTVEVAEEVAKVTKKIAEDVAKGLPEDGNLKKVVLEVEEIANEVIEDAEQAKSIIHKVDEIEEEVEALAEPIIKELETPEKEGK